MTTSFPNLPSPGHVSRVIQKWKCYITSSLSAHPCRDPNSSVAEQTRLEVDNASDRCYCTPFSFACFYTLLSVVPATNAPLFFLAVVPPARAWVARIQAAAAHFLLSGQCHWRLLRPNARPGFFPRQRLRWTRRASQRKLILPVHLAVHHVPLMTSTTCGGDRLSFQRKARKRSSRMTPAFCVMRKLSACESLMGACSF